MANDSMIDLQTKMKTPKNLKLLNHRSANFLLYALPRLMRNIKERTAAGLNADGKPFPPYTPGYKKIKQRRGRDTGTVNLRLSGHMMDNLTMGVTNKGVGKLFFSGSRPHDKRKGTKLNKSTGVREDVMRNLRNQQVADYVNNRYGGGLFHTKGNAKPPHLFMDFGTKDRKWLEGEFWKRVLQPQMKKLPPMFKKSDVPPYLQKYWQFVP